MLFITPSTNAEQAKDYHTRQLAPSDYYTRDAAERRGQWRGLGAELLGLSGDVGQKDFFALCDNRDPQTGASLTARTKADRRVLYDFTFDAPKSVSLAYELGGDERIQEKFLEAVRETMSEMEGAMKARVRKDGRQEDRATCNMVWGEFLHRTTRPVNGIPDPQLHCHATVFNATYDTVEQKWKAAQFADLVRDKGHYQAEFHSRLAKKLADLGYGVERDGKSFKLTGIAKTTTDKFSRRTAIIETEAERLGIGDAKAKGELGRKTREKKDASPKSMHELSAEWNLRLTAQERADIVDARSGQQTKTLDAAGAIDYALSHCFERASVVTENELLTTALIRSVGTANVCEVRSEALRDGILRREVGGQRYVTTKQVLGEELAMVAYAREGRGKFQKLGGVKPASLDENLSEEQRRAARHILDSRDAVTVMIGRAGTGKTRTTQATAKAIEESGKGVFAFAPSARASRGVLRAEGFADADTVEKLLTDPELQQNIHGQVLWIDEAGLLSTPDMKRIFDLAKRQDARIVLSGDISQHASVQRGDALRILLRNSGIKPAELNQVRRQINADYRAAVSAISEGDRLAIDGRSMLEYGLETLDATGGIIEVEGDARYRHIAADYIATTEERKAGGQAVTALVVSPTHAEADKVTAEIRQGLKSTERISGEEREFVSLRNLGLTQAQRSDPLNYRPGDIIEWQKNAKGFTRKHRHPVTRADADGVLIERAGEAVPLPLAQAERFQVYEPETLRLAKGDRLRITQNGFARGPRRGGRLSKSRLDNGDIFEVDGFTKDGDIRLVNGFVVPKSYGGIAHGYVTTSHSSQGATVDKVLIALGQESFAAANREQLYVSVSRGRFAVRLYTDDKAAMLEAVKASSARLSATELMEGHGPVKRKPVLSGRLVDMQRISRAYTAMRERIAQWPMPGRRKEASLGH